MKLGVPDKNILEKCKIEVDYNWYPGDMKIFYNEEGQIEYTEKAYKILHQNTLFMEKWGRFAGPLDGNVRRVLFKDENDKIVSEIIEPNPMYLEDICEENYRSKFEKGILY